MKFSWKSSLCDMVSDSGNIVFVLVCFNASLNYLAVAIIMSMVVSVDMVSLWVYQDTVCPMQTELVLGIKNWFQK